MSALALAACAVRCGDKAALTGSARRTGAAPFATLVAATVVAYFARAQARIAQSQRDIALDKLKFDLIERRYAIYMAAKELLEYAANVSDERIDSNKVRTLYVTLDEARFYFPPDIIEFLSTIHSSCEQLFTQVTVRGPPGCHAD